MWTTVLVLAIAVNFEPSRPTLVPLMLARPRPIVQLTALYLGIFTTGMVAGLLVLFVFHRTPLGTDPVNGGRVQIAIGLFALLIAALTASNLLRRRRGAPAADGGIVDSATPLSRSSSASSLGGIVDSAPRLSRSSSASSLGDPTQRPVEKVAEHARNVLRKGNSAWVSFLLGLGIGLPSVDYLAVLVVIGASGSSPLSQIIALLVFLVLGNSFIAIPLAAYVLAPHRTNRRMALCQIWIRNRTRRQIAAVLVAVGLIQILLGASTLWQHRDHDVAVTASATGRIGFISGSGSDRDGHQLALPTSTAVAGTVMVRTRKVSNRIPVPMMKPI